MYSDCWTYPKEKIDEMVGDVSEAKLDAPSVAGTQGQVLTSDGDGGQTWETPEVPSVPVTDVQIDGTSIVNNGVANVPIGSESNVGVFSINQSYGINVLASGALRTVPAVESQIKGANHSYDAIVPVTQHISAFYGLAKAAGDSTQSASSNDVGDYTDDAKAKIQQMLGIAGLIAPVETGTASQSYSVGQCFLYSGKLCRATYSISASDAIVIGTNCEQTTIMEEIAR